ncbi:hypothetical protein E2562_012385 [Oryza meyeriana var. granulata]|uniref:Uncharacterized protein n=1 Tax=Oryza meyeriana var. granulata TaxID=110450 RepID=A0A6G1C5A2_9ORYZ|nr:hypothetical protein E2562_012385 [Oryza meyeriana var. granulata]
MDGGRAPSPPRRCSVGPRRGRRARAPGWLDPIGDEVRGGGGGGLVVGSGALSVLVDDASADATAFFLVDAQIDREESEDMEAGVVVVNGVGEEVTEETWITAVMEQLALSKG